MWVKGCLLKHAGLHTEECHPPVAINCQWLLRGWSFMSPSYILDGMLTRPILCRTHQINTAAVRSRVQWSCGIQKTAFHSTDPILQLVLSLYPPSHDIVNGAAFLLEVLRKDMFLPFPDFAGVLVSFLCWDKIFLQKELR